MFYWKRILSDCKQLQNPDKGSVSDLIHFHHGDIVTVYCEDHFTLSGNSKLTCTSGKWSDKVGKCEPGENIKKIYILELFWTISQQKTNTYMYWLNQTEGTVCCLKDVKLLNIFI